MRASELPAGIRLKLAGSDSRRMWEEASEQGIGRVAERLGYSRNTVYQWRHRGAFVPADFVVELLEQPEVVAMKGGGRSRPTTGVSFPLAEPEELAARARISVSLNSDGVPVYATRDPGNLRRFGQLLAEIGEVPTSLYSRSRFELRYPKYIHQIIERFGSSECFAAEVDEVGRIEDGVLRANGEQLPVGEFEGELYSSKRLQLALERGEKREVRRILEESAERASSIAP